MRELPSAPPVIPEAKGAADLAANDADRLLLVAAVVGLLSVVVSVVDDDDDGGGWGE